MFSRIIHADVIRRTMAVIVNAVAEVIGIDRIRSEEGENGEKDKESAGDDGDDRKNVAKAVVVVVAPPLKRHCRQ